jgi:hypothetical protein
VENIPDNQAIKDIVMSLEVHCSRHQSVKVESFCVEHFVLVCKVCGHTGLGAGCNTKDLFGDTQEIAMALLGEINRLSQGMPEHLKTPELRRDIEKRFKNAFGLNLKLLEKLQELEESEWTLLCATCQSVADNFVEIFTFDAFCKQCASYNPHNGNLLDIGDSSKEEYAKLLASKVPAILKKINFCHITSNLWDRIAKRESFSVRAVQRLCKELLTMEAPKCDYSSLPDTFICPGCKRSKQKISCMMFILPCQKLHALCKKCVNQAEARLITCPLDLQTFKKRPEELMRLEPSVLPQNPSQMLKFGIPYCRPNFYPGVPELSSNISPVWAFPDPQPLRFGPISNPSPPAPRYVSSGPIPGLPVLLPPFDHRLKSLLRYPAVLPMPGLSASNNKGWSVNCARNQVEAVTMIAFDTCHLVGVGIANPINAGTVAIVDSVSLYNGKTATGQPVAVHRGMDQLRGGSQQVTFVTFAEPFAIPAMTTLTLKVKLVAPPSNPSITSLELYRGNPYNRPDLCIGTDDLLWEFEETKKVGEGEMTTGENTRSGPILALLYQH